MEQSRGADRPSDEESRSSATWLEDWWSQDLIERWREVEIMEQRALAGELRQRELDGPPGTSRKRLTDSSHRCVDSLLDLLAEMRHHTHPQHGGPPALRGTATRRAR